MRSVLLIFLLLPSFLVAQTIAWEDPIPVASEEWDNNRPRLTLNAEGLPVVMWGNNVAGEVHVALGDGDSFSDPLSGMMGEYACFTADWAGPELSGSGNNMLIAFKATPENTEGIYLLSSEDGGSTWGQPVLISMDEEVDQTRLPDVAIDDSGEIHLTFMTFEGNYIDPAYAYKTSEDGENWSVVQNISTSLIEGEACDCCTADIISSGETVVQLWRNNIDNIREIYAVISTDGGANFDQILEIDHSDTYSNVCFSSGPNGVIEGDNLISVFRKNVGTDRRIGLVVTDLLTGENSLEETVGGLGQGNVNYNNAKIAQDGAFTAIVYEEGMGNGSEIICSVSNGNYENLISFKDTVNVSLTGRQTNPDVALNGDQVHVVWQDADTDQVWYRKGSIQTSNTVSELEISWGISPNPTDGKVFFTSQKPLSATIDVFNTYGSLVYSFGFVNERQKLLDIGFLDNGVYLMVAHVNGIYSTKKLVVSH
ncbi:MAG: hypothetical protein ACJAU0_000623 [Flavobacteriales bacterium]|jgi:hypothetical protein